MWFTICREFKSFVYKCILMMKNKQIYESTLSRKGKLISYSNITHSPLIQPIPHLINSPLYLICSLFPSIFISPSCNYWRRCRYCWPILLSACRNLIKSHFQLIYFILNCWLTCRGFTYSASWILAALLSYLSFSWSFT